MQHSSNIIYKYVPRNFLPKGRKNIKLTEGNIGTQYSSK